MEVMRIAPNQLCYSYGVFLYFNCQSDPVGKKTIIPCVGWRVRLTMDGFTMPFSLKEVQHELI